MDKELSTAEKSRKTKLSKMTNEELIKIIFRKDETEHKYKKINVCLKQNIVGLEIKIKNIQAYVTTLEENNVELANNNEKQGKIIIERDKVVEALQISNKQLHDEGYKFKVYTKNLLNYSIILTIVTIILLIKLFI